MPFHLEKPNYMQNHNFLNRFFLLASVLFIGLSLQAQEQVIDKVVAVVGENIVLLSDIEGQIDQMTLNDLAVTENSRCEVLEDLMYQKLFVNGAKADSVEVGENAVEQELNRRLRYFVGQVGSEEELEKFYGKTMEQIKEDFREEVQNILLIQQMQQEITGAVKVSPQDVREFYKAIPKDSLPYINSEVRVAHIVRLPKVSDEQEKEIIGKLNDFRDRVAKGEDFGTLAYLYSQDPGSAMNNGELGLMDRTELVPEFSNAANGLEKDQVSDVVKTQFGYHIIQMIDRKGDRINVRHILLIPQVSPTDLQKSRKFLDSLKTEIKINDSINFAQAAVEFSTDDETRMNGGELINPLDGTNKFDLETLGQVDRQLLFSVEKMKVGDIIGPDLYQGRDGKKSYRLVRLLERTEPHVANLNDDYNRLSQSTKRKKENEQLENWVSNNRNSAYIWVDPSFQTCPFKIEWTIAQR
jgi:peptidyl-prolyl cis-trans isomerase SurA